MPVNDALNKPKTKLGMDYRILGGCFCVSVLVFLIGTLLANVWLAIVLSLGMFGIEVVIAKALTFKDQKFFTLMANSFIQSASYDPGRSNQ